MGIRLPPAVLSATRPRLMARSGTGTVGVGEAAFPSAAAAARGLCWRSVAGGSRGDGDLGTDATSRRKPWHGGPCCFRRPASSAVPVLCLARRGAGADQGGARRIGADGRVGAGDNAGVYGDMEDEGITVDQANAKKADGLKAVMSYLREVKWILIHATGVALITNTLWGLVLYGIYRYGYDKAYGAIKRLLLSYVKDEEIYAKVYSYSKKLLLGYLADQDIRQKVYSYSKKLLLGYLADQDIRQKVYSYSKKLLLGYLADQDIRQKVYSYLKKLLLGYLADQDIRQKVPAALQDIAYRTLLPINPFPALKKRSPDERAFFVHCAYFLVRWFWLP